MKKPACAGFFIYSDWVDKPSSVACHVFSVAGDDYLSGIVVTHNLERRFPRFLSGHGLAQR